MELLQQQNQKQFQRLSQRQIQAISMLGMNSRDLREAIFKEASENPALEIVSDPLSSSAEELSYTTRTKASESNSNSFQAALESQESHLETLQQHLMKQLSLCKISDDEYELCQKLIYNLDKNGCYGSMIAPQTLLNKTRPVQNQKMLETCLDLIQRMDPVGTCCKNPEESLFVQAKIKGDASALTLFILDGHLDFLNPPQADKIQKAVVSFRNEWHSKKFATALPIDDIKITVEEAQKSLDYILKLNPRPAGDYISDVSESEFNSPDVILTVTKVPGVIVADDFENGKIAGTKEFYFQVKYASGVLPELRISKELAFDKENVGRARQFLDNLNFRKSSIVLQGCAIVAAQRQFFIEGPLGLQPLLRKQIAEQIGVHESTVSRLSSKKNSRYIQCSWGVFPLSYFFGSSVEAAEGDSKISSQVIKTKIVELTSKNEKISDSELTRILNEMGIKIARRTVAKYRSQSGIKNSYLR